MENITGYLQNHAQLNFTFALVAEELYRIGEGNNLDILVQPRVIAKTVEIERAVIRIEGDAGTVTNGASTSILTTGASEKKKASSRRETITEQVFFEEIEKLFTGYSSKVKALFDELNEKGLTIEAGSSAMLLKDRAKQFNFLGFQKDGTVRNYGLGNSLLGVTYMEKLTELTKQTVIYKSSNGFFDTVKKYR